MSVHVRRLEIGSVDRARLELAGIGVDPTGISSTIPKQFYYNLKVSGLSPELVKLLLERVKGPGVQAAVGPGEPGNGVASALLSGTPEGFRALSAGLISLSGHGQALELASGIERAIGALLQGPGVLKGRSRDLTPGGRTLVMGILNVTPDSFYDGGSYSDPGAAVDRALEMVEEGADWIDVGGESTRPGAAPVEEGTEAERVVPVVEALAVKGLTVSVDTTKAAVARAALEAGGEIINDVSALGADPMMAGVCAEYGAAVVLMHMRGTPRTMQNDVAYGDLPEEVFGYLASRLEFARERGIDEEKTLLDPGIGFGKSVEGNLELLREVPGLKSLGRPVLIGASRKSFIGHLAGPGDRLAGSLAAATAAVFLGAGVLRVHDVRETVQAIRVIDAIRGVSAG